MPNLINSLSPLIRLPRLRQFLMHEDALAGEILNNSPNIKAHIIRKINALHPGDGLGRDITRKHTDFGSPLDIGKAVLRAAGLMEEKAIAKPPMINIISDKPYNHPTWLKQRIEKRLTERLQERPTMGLVTNVLGDSTYHHGHAKFMGKSY